MAELALSGVSYFHKVQGEHNVKYWFLSDPKSVAAFHAKQPFNHFKMGDVVNEASQMKQPLTGKVYLALTNDNSVEPILVIIKVTAVLATTEKGVRNVQKAKLIPHDEPYLMN